MKIYDYENYQDYVDAQTEANKRKLNRVWTKQSVINKAKFYKEEAQDILCHGVRNGAELHMFRSVYGAGNIIGTEISETATQFPNVVQHDFQDVREEWVGQFDIVYSNSFDHAFDPERTLTAWKDQLKEDGVVIIELMIGNENRSKRTDPLEISQKEFKDLAAKVGLELIGAETALKDQSNLFAFKKV